MKEVKVKLSHQAEQVYNHLNEQVASSKEAKMIFNAINKKVKLIKANVHYGEPIAKRLIPREYKLKYGISNLFRVGLPRFWRMLYTLTNGEDRVEIIAFVLDFLDHNEYDKKFGYRKR